MPLRRILFLVFCSVLLCSTWMQAENRVAKKRVPPVYPELARKMHVTGTVKLEVNVDAEGQVQDVKVLSGHALLRDAAVTAAKQWVFQTAPAKTIEVVDIGFQ